MYTDKESVVPFEIGILGCVNSVCCLDYKSRGARSGECGGDNTKLDKLRERQCLF